MTESGEKDAEATTNAADGYSKEAVTIIGLLGECGINEFDPRVVSMLMDVGFWIFRLEIIEVI